MFLALFLYSETTVFIQFHGILFLLVFVCAYRRKEIERKAKRSHLILIGLLIVFSLLNNLFHVGEVAEIKDVIPYTLFFILTYFVCLLIDAQFVHTFCFLICMEIVVGCFEFAAGVNTFFPELSSRELKEFGGSEFLYKSRVFGLSNNSSQLGEKCILLLILSQFIKSKKIKVVCVLFATLGYALTFPRTAIIASLVFLVVMTWQNKKILLGYIISGAMFVYYFIDLIMIQFFRGTGTIDLSKRDVIWPEFYRFFVESPLLGNGGFKYYIDAMGKTDVHAHNSYLQVLVNQGAIYFALMVLVFMFNVNKHNFKLLVPILVYSIYQTGIFWAISLFDIVLYFLLFRLKGSHKTMFALDNGGQQWKLKS